jgi:hypothetical protein
VGLPHAFCSSFYAPMDKEHNIEMGVFGRGGWGCGAAQLGV